MLHTWFHLVEEGREGGGVAVVLLKDEGGVDTDLGAEGDTIQCEW